MSVEPFTIDGTQYLVMGYDRETEVWRWNTTSFEKDHTLPKSLSNPISCEALEFQNATYLFTAGRLGGYKIFRWENKSFVHIQSIGTDRVEISYFARPSLIEDTMYLHTGTENDDEVWRWDGTSFSKFQQLQPTRFPIGSTFFEIRGTAYLAVSIRGNHQPIH